MFTLTLTIDRNVSCSNDTFNRRSSRKFSPHGRFTGSLNVGCGVDVEFGGDLAEEVAFDLGDPRLDRGDERR